MPHVWGYSIYPVVNGETCIACATCYELCPAEPKVFEIKEISTVVYPDACLDCGACEESCPTNSIILTE
ncbi:4Fe-4S binding protein [Pelotomaculum terephthalicicum JT]|uniref:4Fe-4S dicluster domain-containing protein n=1 Tax=Pelotomaculum TaxID=191373 RepID=UPI0009CE4BBE|nr:MULTISPECIES: 4Fe-4S binding protein [Pelotomaculum]MCG9968757.1 4Fe-4S binding protein [Pelotomaculum terephthalicicum JT]OPX84615.1 MAG: Electron transport complex protein rnfB [Pelotomaculum sp. PtaB.Bin117]OPY63342.1 MAG: Electron transport complex protein rnfB [Pelotomaculum sp. PtaU1.Bin065]